MSSSSPTIAPYGAWPSPISADMLTRDSTGFAGVGSDGINLLWLEARGNEGGRNTLMGQEGNDVFEISPAPFNLRSRVHEYGGGVWAVTGETVVWSNFTDNRLYRRDGGTTPQAITPVGPYRYADLQIDLIHNRIVCVREDHSVEDAEPTNTLVALSLDGPNEDGGTVLISGSDFYGYPRFNANFDRLLWLSWNHPNMPWDGTSLFTAMLSDDNVLGDPFQVDGGLSRSIAQPGWDSKGRFIYVSDSSGWWNLWRADHGSNPVQLTQEEAEFATPQWVFGLSNWTLLDDETIFCSWTKDGVWYVGVLDTNLRELTQIGESFADISNVQRGPTPGTTIFIAGSNQRGRRIMTYNHADGSLTVTRESPREPLDPGYLSIPESVSWETTGGTQAHGFLYLPTNRDAHAPEGELPPLIVESHGGPTSVASSAFDLSTQYWTSRGFAILDVNYGGSTGYGREYRERLNGSWGVVDVDDCVSGAQALVARGLVDGNRLAIRGGSAGGYTTLAALAFRSLFKVGISYYGVADLEALATDTHKFESRYMDNLVGPYPEAKTLYQERSPIHHLENLNAAMILLQGLEDKVVPPSQAYAMADAVRARNLPLAMVIFSDEGHGFRKAENKVKALESELSFLGQVFGFNPADQIEKIEVENL